MYGHPTDKKHVPIVVAFQCFDAVGWAAGRATDL